MASSPPDLAAELAQAVQAYIALLGSFTTLRTEEADWVGGVVGGGDQGDGTYPFTQPDGTVVRLPCLLQIIADLKAAVGGATLYDGLTFTGALGDAEQLVGNVVTAKLTLPAALTGSVAAARAAPDAAFTLTLLRVRGADSAPILTATVAAGSTAVALAVVGGADVALLPGDVLVPQGPSPAVPAMTSLDATLLLVPTP